MSLELIGIVGNGRVGSAVIELFKKHYSILAYDPLYIAQAPIENIRFTSSIGELSQCLFVIICVPTPQAPDGSCDSSLVDQTVKSIPNDFIIIKSTIEPATTDRLKKETGKRIVFSPEYIGESTYYNPYFNTSMMETPFVVLGGDKDDTSAVIDLLLPILGPMKTYFQTSALNAEMIKYVENTYFATKVTFVNEIYEICKKIGADWNEVREGWLLDPRIERMHTAVFPNKRGFGGKCYPKDLSTLIAASVKNGYEPKLLKQVERSNADFSAMNEGEQLKSEEAPIPRLKQKTILVTGGAGFIGSFVSRKLIELGYRVVIVDNFNNYYDPILKEHRIKLVVGDSVKIYRIDITDYHSLKTMFNEQNIDQICHLAAQAGVRYSLENPFVYEESNIKGTLNILQCAIEHGISGFIFASSSSVYGQSDQIPFSESNNTDTPISLYAATKKATELLVRSYHTLHGLRATGLRYFTAYGPWGRPDMALFKFTNAVLKGSPIDVYGNGDMKRDFTYIEDIVDGTVRALEKNQSWEIVNLGFGRPVHLQDFISCIEQATHRKALKRLLPMQPGDVALTYADTTRAKQLYNWSPLTPIEQGVGHFVKWYRDYYKV